LVNFIVAKIAEKCVGIPRADILRRVVMQVWKEGRTFREPVLAGPDISKLSSLAELGGSST